MRDPTITVGDVRKAVKKMKILSAKQDSKGMIEYPIVDYRMTTIGRQNWEVCARMLVHDLLDLSEKDKALKAILDHYAIRYLPDGGYTMRLPRLLIGKL